MIQGLRLRNLKCFEQLDIRLAPLTLLTGFNAAGKSTTLQALLLLAQTLRTHSRSGELQLNGPLVSLGTPGEVLNENHSSEPLGLGLAFSEHRLDWTFSLEDDHARRYLKAKQLTTEAQGATQLPVGMFPPALNDLLERRCKGIEEVIYVGANRETSGEVFPSPRMPLAPGDPGCTGQFAPWQFYQYADDDIDQLRCMPHSPPGTVRKALNTWLGELFPGAEANATTLPGTDLMKLEFRTTSTGEWHRPSNVGFGLSYAFPMLVAGLCSRAGQTIVIDSPEAHLHPLGQSVTGQFAAHVASAGQQLIVETHSDHFLNGVRIAVKNGVLDPSDLANYFFMKPPNTQVTELAVDKNGNLNAWPSGFFDQAEQDLAVLAGWN